jgi:peroxiredoxin
MKRALGFMLAACAMVTLPAMAATNGSAAPEFSLTDLGGKPVKLSDYKGKFVVLEWNNPNCPFVRKHYDSGNMQALQKSTEKDGAVWLTISSTNTKSGEYMDAAKLQQWIQQKSADPSAYLLDGDGKVGKLYSAKTTPHMYVVNPEGKLIYQGAIDDKRSADPADVKTAKNYVTAALTEARAGNPVTTPTTTPYGCSVKY